MNRTADQIIAVIHRHAKTAEKGNVKVDLASWRTLESMVKELEATHQTEIGVLNAKLAKALAPPPPPPPIKKKVFVNGRLVLK